MKLLFIMYYLCVGKRGVTPRELTHASIKKQHDLVFTHA